MGWTPGMTERRVPMDAGVQERDRRCAWGKQVGEKVRRVALAG